MKIAGTTTTTLLAALCVVPSSIAFAPPRFAVTPRGASLFSYLDNLAGSGPSDEDKATDVPSIAEIDEDRRAREVAGPMNDGLPPPPPPPRGRDSRTKSLENRLSNLEKGASAPGPRRSGPGRDRMIDRSAPQIIQGGSLKTWAYASPAVQRVQVVLQTEGRPLDADIELWQGPDNTPHKMRVYVEDGALRPFNAVIETPRGPNTVAIRNIGQLEFPMDAFVVADIGEGNFPDSMEVIETADNRPLTIQGGALKTYPFDPTVESVQVVLRTDGRPLRARIELLQGPNNNKQVMEVYTEDGLDRPFFATIETPGSGNVVRIVNAATVEFPLTAWVEPLLIGDAAAAGEAIIGGDTGRGARGFPY